MNGTARVVASLFLGDAEMIDSHNTSMSRNRKLTLILTGVLVTIAALALPKTGWFSGRTPSNGVATVSREQGMQVSWHVVEPTIRGDRVATVGTILSNEEVEIRSEVSGKIEEILFREGAYIRKGDQLLLINDAELKAQLMRAEASQLLAEQQKERQRQLFEKNLTSQEAFDNAAASLDMVRAEVQLIAAQHEKTRIKAPFNGRIGLRNVSEGSYLTPTTLITTLQDYSSVKIDFSVPEKYAGSIRRGDKITFGVQGTARVFRGTIYAVQPKIDQGTRTLRVRAKAPNSDGALVPGSLATIDVSLKEQEALMIPSYAIVPELKGHMVFLYKNGTASSRQVKIGSRTDESVEVVDGLRAGDTLITSGILQLRPGMPVQLAQNSQVGPPADVTGE